MGEGLGKVRSDATAQRITDDADGVGACPWERARGHAEEHLGDIEAFVMGKIADAI